MRFLRVDRFYKSIIVLVVFCLISFQLKSQVAIGSWQEYIALNDVFDVVHTQKSVVAAANMGIFVVDTEEGILTKYTKVNGLSDIGISAICSVPSSNIVIIGYSNGNIDFFEDGVITNLPDLKNKTLIASKNINSINVINDLAYFATDFGIVVVDYLSNEILDTYYIGENAGNLKVNQLTTFQDSIFAATTSGLLAAPLNSELLYYYETWKNVSYDSKEYSSVVAFSDSLRTTVVNGNSVSIKSYKGGMWSAPVNQTYSSFVQFRANDAYNSLVTKAAIYNFNNYFALSYKITSLRNEDEIFSPNFSCVAYFDNEAWIGDSQAGLFNHVSQGYDTQYLPNGPASNTSYKIAATANKLYSVIGVTHEATYNPKTLPAELSILDNNRWVHLTRSNNLDLSGKSNLCDIAIDPTDNNRAYIASSRSGILELYNNEITNWYDETNSSVQAYGSWRIVNSVVCDESGNLLAANQAAKNPIICFTNEETNWSSFDYLLDGNVAGQPWIHNLLSVGDGQFWGTCVFPESGLFVFDTQNQFNDATNHIFRSPQASTLDDRHSKLSLWNTDGEVYDASPQCLALDKKGYVWVGTNSGPLVYYQPRRVFEEAKPVASKVKIARNDGSGLADYLLEGVSINAIAVDGANRKWMGTNGEGVYLISADGTRNLLHFTVEDSPLLSNTINSIAINPSSGEVFFATDKGIVSYRGTATEGEKTYSKVYAFPNPVRPEYQGNITVKGLMENTNVKITDVSGKLVYEAVSTGGQLVWDGRNMNNTKVKSGVYLVFATNTDGSQSVATKIMIVR